MPASAWDKFLLLSWKNWIIQIRHPIQTLFEILIPVMLCAGLVLVRGLVEIAEQPDDIRYRPIEASKIGDEVLLLRNLNYRLAYSPKNPLLDQIFDNVKQQFGFLEVTGLYNSTVLEANGLNIKPFASFEFDDNLRDMTALPEVINYAIRFPAELRTNDKTSQRFSGSIFNWFTKYKFLREFTVGPRNEDSNDGGTPPGYIGQGFIAIQNALEREIIYATTNFTSDDLPKLFIQRFPYPAYMRDILGAILEFALPQLFVIAFIYNTINTIKYVAVEKELQLKEAMKVMGLPSYMHWIAWFTKCMLFQVIITSALTVMFKIKFESRGGLGIITYTHWTIVWLFMFLYVMAAITYSFLVTTFFSRANIASVVGAIVWFVLLLPYSVISPSYNNFQSSTKLFFSVFCNSGMAFGFKVMMQYESAGVGVQWSNLFSPVSPDDDLTLGGIMVMLLIASAVQMIIALYVEKIKPGEFGVAEKFYFPFQLSFWTGRVKARDNESGFDFKSNPNFEAEPVGKNAGIQVRGLRKVYDKKVAVKNLNLNMFEDQITVLLGHNGAGKSTTMSMLTGLFSPTSGTAYIDGKDIRSDLNSIRSSLGLCPQHNVLFNELTVKEHITFFSKLKGVKKASEIDEQIRKYVNLLELTPKLNAQSKTLSGGMKRKLSIGIALCGGSKIVMCDEPTSGMDPTARRALWDLLIQEKKGRTILLTTHFMDEADVLGDRIAIMAEGDLKTVGSSFFLKKKFGVGYRLVCVKTPGCDPNQMTRLLSNYIPGIQVETDIGSELTYVLNEEYIGQFKVIFADLETKASQLGISSFGVSLTTLEEVFLKVGTDSNVLSENSKDTMKANENGEKIHTFTESGFESTFTIGGSRDILQLDLSRFLTGTRLYWNQVVAMTTKKGLYSIRNYIMLIIQFSIPTLYLAIAMVTSSKELIDNLDLPELPISFDSYFKTTTAGQKAFVSGSPVENIYTKYENTIKALSADHSFSSTEQFIEDYILDRYRESLSKVNLNYLVGASFSKDNITAWFNNQVLHTAPLSVNAINNAIWKHASGSDVRSIKLTNKPLPFATATKLKQAGDSNNLGFKIAFNTGFAMALVIAMFVVFYIKERVTRAKLLQFVSGVNKGIFWMTSFVIDYIVFMFITLVFISVLIAYQKDGFQTYDELARYFYLLAIFGFSALPFTYVLSFLFQIPSTGLVRLSIGYIISGVFFFLAYFILNEEILNLRYISKPFGWVALLFPHYSLARGMSNINVLRATLNICEERCHSFEECSDGGGIEEMCKAFEIDCTLDYSNNPLREGICVLKNTCCDRSFYSFEEDGIGLNLAALALVGVLSFIALFAIEYRWIQNLFYKFKKTQRPTNIPESEDGIVDSDVMAEKNKIRSVTSYLQATNNLIVKDFTKFYGKMLAVNQICVGVDKGECFGLLGVNGAGKTSTFKMLTGDETISSGEAWVEGISVKTAMNKVHQRIGYCPQFDALLDELTGRETLRIFALLKGIRSREIDRISLQLANELNFAKHLDKRIKAYSGGNKRKLSTALAMIGDPSVIYLDEPTSGMDVGARRQLWNVVIEARNAGKSVVLTSHSMEECEVLCTRLAIMVNGEFKCLGSTQHLKNKFSKGFFLTIKIGYENQAETLDQKIISIKNFVSQNFSGAVLKEEYMDILTFHIPTADVKWSQMFGLMEGAKTRLNISDYSLGQTSLEQVFLFFTKYQRATK